MPRERIKKIKLVRSRLFFTGGIAGALLLSCIIYFAMKSQNITIHSPTATIRDTEIILEIAKTPEEKARGLCCRDQLAENYGMLFVYEQLGDYRFWMKDTKIPLDMYWLNSEKKIVHIERDVQPSSYPKSFSSPVPAQYILETNTGFAVKYDIQVGDSMGFKD